MPQSGGIRLDGRKLFIVAAVSKEDAAKLKVTTVKVESGTRNLYLAREGCKSTPFCFSFLLLYYPFILHNYLLSILEVLLDADFT